MPNAAARPNAWASPAAGTGRAKGATVRARRDRRGVLLATRSRALDVEPAAEVPARWGRVSVEASDGPAVEDEFDVDDEGCVLARRGTGLWVLLVVAARGDRRDERDADDKRNGPHGLFYAPVWETVTWTRCVRRPRVG
jgi:hypothetical protein